MRRIGLLFGGNAQDDHVDREQFVAAIDHVARVRVGDDDAGLFVAVGGIGADPHPSSLLHRSLQRLLVLELPPFDEVLDGPDDAVAAGVERHADQARLDAGEDAVVVIQTLQILRRGT